VEAENFDCVTVYFSDIVGFTQICAKADPMEVKWRFSFHASTRHPPVVDFFYSLFYIIDSVVCDV